MNNYTLVNSYPRRRLRYLSLGLAILTFLMIVVGGIVRVTGSGGACLDWPTCLGQWAPPMGDNARIDYLHRLFTLLIVPLFGLRAYWAWKYERKDRLAGGSIFVSLSLLLIQIALGGVLALNPALADAAWLSAVHLGLSLSILGSLLLSTVVGYYSGSVGSKHGMQLRLNYRSSFARLVLLTFGAIFTLLVSGALVSGSDASTACETWLFCQDIPSSFTTLSTWVNILHRISVLLTAFMVMQVVLRAWRTQRTQPSIMVAATALGVLFSAQALLGAKLVDDFPFYLFALHQATAVAVWASMVILVVTVGLAGRTSEDERLERIAIKGRKGLARDLLMLTKPIVVALLLVTTFAGMVIGAQEWPSFSIVFWTLLGGFMAAGGSGAINQYIDRYDDEKMQRTQKRPIPSGRLTPGEGVAFGVALTLGSFYILVAFVNLTAALLSLAGIIYYVLIYSIFLKKTTVQNIVIGGGAGAIPPLVGWAAVTGGLNIPSLFLFAIIFMWTPPHFWALALVRRKDYARAGVPMLPVIRGEQETRWQIFLYTLELVALTLLLPLFGLGGAVYFVGAFLLGGWLLGTAWRVWKQGGNKLAWKMYRYSSMYLAFIFVVLMVDRLL